MIISLTTIDRFALVFYTIFLGGTIGGVWLIKRSSGKKRTWGITILVESVAAIALMTLMSTDYWISNTRSGIMDINVRSILYAIAYMLPSVILGSVIIGAAMFFAIRFYRHGNLFLSGLLLCACIPIFFFIGLAQLSALTEQTRPKLSDQKTSEVRITPGFQIAPFMTEPANKPTSIIFKPDGNLFIANHNGDIWFISFKDGTSKRFASGFVIPVGLAWRDETLYVASRGKITAIQDTNGDNIADESHVIVTDLPAGIYPWHGNNGIVFGPDGRLYFSVGATSDAAPETYQYAASILSVKADGSDLQIYATGVRNSYRLAFNTAGDLFATDNAPGLLDTTPPDELNQIIAGGDYGFPWYFGLPLPDSGTIAPLALFPPHSSADGLEFYQSDKFPTEYYDNAFVTLWSTGDIYRVRLTKSKDETYQAQVSIFISGLTNPLDLDTGPDGNLYVIDFGASTIYKISYFGN